MKRSITGILLVASAFLLLSASTMAQAPDTVWSHTYIAHSAAKSLYAMPDGGFVIGGYVTPAGESYRDVFIVRTDANGDTLWTRAIGLPDQNETGNCLYPTADGGFILTGNVAEAAPYSSYSDVLLVKTDSLGVAQWASGFGTGQEAETGVAVAPAIDGGYLIGAYFWNSTTGFDIWMVKADNLGNLQWPEHVTWADADYPTAICRTNDSGFALTGFTQSFDTDYDYDMFIRKLDQNGTESWAFAYGSAPPWDESANDICHTSDGGYLLCGHRQQSGGVKNVYVVKTDQSGAIDWTAELGGTYHDVGWSCIETVDGGYAVAASWYRNGNWQVGLIKFNSDGDTLWTATWGDPAHGHTPYGLVQTADNGYVVAGLQSGDTTKAFLVKFDADPGYDPYIFHSDALTTPVDDVNAAVDTLTVYIDDGGIGDLSVVGVRITVDTLEHPEVGEISVTVAHDGAEATLIALGDVTGSNLTGTVFADAAPDLISSGLAPYTGTFRPDQNLGVFTGQNPNGDWVLTIADHAVVNDGTLRGWSISLLTDIALDVDDPGGDDPIPDYHLAQCYPNPFNPTTTIRYSLPRRADVTLAVFNALGQKIATLVSGSRPAGSHQAVWDGTNANGDEVSAGVYFYRLEAGDFVASRKMVLLK